MNSVSVIAEYLVVVLLLTGGSFSLVGSYGLAKLSDFYKRLHGPTKATTLGVGGILLAGMLLHLLRGDGTNLRELLITIFLFLTAPVSAHMMAKAALALRPADRPARPDAASKPALTANPRGG
jgi:multicomponent K+:H+ antiporter subunit G